MPMSMQRHRHRAHTDTPGRDTKIHETAPRETKRNESPSETKQNKQEAENGDGGGGDGMGVRRSEEATEAAEEGPAK